MLLGFAPAKLLAALSFADVLNEATGTGYQRRFSVAHSQDFRRYIQRPGSTTIPLTFNLRPDEGAWELLEDPCGARILFHPGAGPSLAQVDCQHRLGRISDLDVSLPFMCFVGLSPEEELNIFSVINSKARGIRGSLLDYHAAQMAEDLGEERPELLISLHLNASEDSPWYRLLDLGGDPTVGMKRRASLRLMQQAVKRFLGEVRTARGDATPEVTARIVLDFWAAVSTVLPQEWANPRKHYLTKGVGVYALMGLLADLWNEWSGSPSGMQRPYFEGALSEFACEFDWSTQGPLKGLGGGAGAQHAVQLLRATRRAAKNANASASIKVPPRSIRHHTTGPMPLHG